MDTIKINTTDLARAHSIANEMGLIIDHMYGGLGKTMSVGARKMGPRGNHEPRWTETQRMVFAVAMEH